MNDLALLEFVFALGEDGDLVLVNPEDSPAEFLLEYVDNGGGVMRSSVGTIAPRGRAVVSSRTLRAAGELGGYYRGRSNRGLLPLFVALRGERLVLQPAANAAVTGAPTKYLGHFVAGAGYTSRLGLVNLDETAQEFMISLQNDDGSLLGSPLRASVPADGAVVIAGVTPFGLESNTAGIVQGYLRIEGVNGRFVGQAVIGDPGEDRFGTALAAAGPLGGEIRCAQAANTDLWYTGAALLNPAEQAAPVYVLLFDPRGKILASRNLVIPARSRWLGLLSQLFGGLPPVEAGYLRIGAGQLGITVAVIGATDLSSLATISR